MMNPENHRFLDESGDPVFYRKGTKQIAIGQEGVSRTFLLGMVKFKQDFAAVRKQVQQLQQEVEQDPRLSLIPSVSKRIKKLGRFFFHAKDDPKPVRELFFEFIRELNFSAEVVVGRKIEPIFRSKHERTESLFYTDLLAHLLKKKLNKDGKLVLNIASRGSSTANQNLQTALEIAKNRRSQTTSEAPKRTVVFNVQNQITEPLLNIADYSCWCVQRVFEKADVYHFEQMRDNFSLIVDLYDFSRYERYQNYYSKSNPLTLEKINYTAK